MTRIARVLALVLVILFACTAGLTACAPANEAAIASTPEPTITATATMSFSPSPALTPSPVATSTPIDFEEKARLGISHENQIVPFNYVHSVLFEDASGNLKIAFTFVETGGTLSSINELFTEERNSAI